MAKRNPAFTEVDAFTAGYKIIADKLIKHVTPQLKRGVSVRVAVNSAFRELKIRKSVQDIIMDFMVAAFVKGGIEVVANVPGLKKWFLDKHWQGEGLNPIRKN